MDNLWDMVTSDSQWQRLQMMRERALAAKQGGPGVQGQAGAQSGPDPLPFSQVPGGGSAANAIQPPNPMVDDRQNSQQLSEDAFANALLGYGVAGGSMMAGPNPLTLLGAVGGGLYGLGNNAVSNYAGRKARNLGYQGN